MPPPTALPLTAADGTPLVADLFTPPATPRALVLIGGAMGVPRRYYAPFAAFLAERGAAALTLDYRGISGSRSGPLRGSGARLHEWGELDLTAGARELVRRFPGVGLSFVGHSVGGQLFGLVDAEVRAALFVASQSGHWRLWPGASRFAMAALWHLGIPAMVPLAGRLPMASLGLGEDVPPGVALDWARWGRDRDYLQVHARTVGGARYVRYDGPLRMEAIEDDSYAPPRTVEALAHHYPRARIEAVRVTPSAAGVRRIGHFGWFRPRFRESLWSPAADWLTARA